MPWSNKRPAPATSESEWVHRKARAEWAKRHHPADPCARCRRPLGPMGPWLHLDHNHARDGYLGFSHGKCNTSAGAKEGRRRQTISQLRW